MAREKAVLRPRKTQPSPISSGTPTPTKHLRPSFKSKHDVETGDKAVLESQIKELLAEAKTKDSEITKLRSELKKRRDKELLNSDTGSLLDQGTDVSALAPANVESLIRALQEKNRTFQRELLSLGEENRLLKEKLGHPELSPSTDVTSSSGADSSLPTPTTQDSSFGSPTKHPQHDHVSDGNLCVYRPPLHNSGSSSSDVTKASLSPDASDFEHIMDVPSRPASSSSNHFKTSRCSTTGSSPNTTSDLSVASLTERIQRMEETHHSTAEELQATLQELSDQQQVVQELTAENEKLVEEKVMLETSFCQNQERAEQLSKENEKLVGLLQERPKHDEGKSRDAKVQELEQKCTELLEKAQFEREKMLNIQQQLTSSLRSLEREHQDSQVAFKNLKEENERLGSSLEMERQSSATLARTLEDCKVSLEGLKIESGSLRSQLDSEKQKAAAINVLEHHGDHLKVQEMLKASRAEKDQLELACTELKQEMLKARSEVKALQGQLTRVRWTQHLGPVLARLCWGCAGCSQCFKVSFGSVVGTCPSSTSWAVRLKLETLWRMGLSKGGKGWASCRATSKPPQCKSPVGPLWARPTHCASGRHCMWTSSGITMGVCSPSRFLLPPSSQPFSTSSSCSLAQGTPFVFHWFCGRDSLFVRLGTSNRSLQLTFLLPAAGPGGSCPWEGPLLQRKRDLAELFTP